MTWKRASRNYQRTHDGRYWVERAGDNGHFGRWHAHRSDYDEQLTFDGFATRAEAKTYCEEFEKDPDR